MTEHRGLSRVWSPGHVHLARARRNVADGQLVDFGMRHGCNLLDRHALIHEHPVRWVHRAVADHRPGKDGLHLGGRQLVFRHLA